jgi:glucose/arabinose dehydrogenase
VRANRSSFVRVPILAAALAVVSAVWLSASLQRGGGSAQPTPLDVSALFVPQGFRIDIYAENVTGARQMALGAGGTLFVGSRQPGLVHAVVDRDGDFKADEVKVIARGLAQPNGVAFRDNALYVATQRQILRFDHVEHMLDAPPPPVTVRDDLPMQGNNHSWKFIAFGPDGLLYVPIGAPCNVCAPPAPEFASIMRMKPDGSDFEVFARGVRNTVGFDWHPVTGELWFTDNGRDNLGDDVPNDELNVAYRPGLHFGFPFCHQGDLPDPEFGQLGQCSAAEPPVQKMGPHVAAIGMTFYAGSMFPASYRNAAIIAQHGSWNRTRPIGYRVMVARTDGRTVSSYEPLVDGFLPGVRFNVDGQHTGAPAMGRPADVLVLPDGSLLISDDAGGRILRLTYGG